MDYREPRGQYRGRRRVPAAPRNRYAAVMTTAFVGAGVVALITGTVLPDTPDQGNLALVDANALSDAAQRADAADRASRSEARDGADAAEQVAPDVYVLPLRKYELTSEFGSRPTLDGKDHPGVDLAAPAGTQYYAIARGTVILARHNGGYGMSVMIDHGGGIVSVYGHSSKLLVKEGQTVEAGQTLGLVGNTGYAFGAHLHLEIRLDNEQVDPMPWLRAKGAEVVGSTDPLNH